MDVVKKNPRKKLMWQLYEQSAWEKWVANLSEDAIKTRIAALNSEIIYQKGNLWEIEVNYLGLKLTSHMTFNSRIICATRKQLKTYGG